MGAPGPAALEQRPPDAAPVVLGITISSVSSSMRRSAPTRAKPTSSPSVLADPVAAVRLGGDELEQRPLAQPLRSLEAAGSRRWSAGSTPLRSRRDVVQRRARPSSKVGREVAGACPRGTASSRSSRRLRLGPRSRAVARRARGGWPSWPSSADARPKNRPDRPVRHQPQPPRRCPASSPGGRCGPRTRPGSRAAARPSMVATAWCWPMSTNTPSVL